MPIADIYVYKIHFAERFTNLFARVLRPVFDGDLRLDIYILMFSHFFLAFLGVSCAIFGAILVGITVALALRRYSQYKRSQTRLWELQ